MKLRTQLVLAFLVVAVVPLTGIVLYSYASSSEAVRVAALAEAEEMSRAMEARLEEVKEELRRDLDGMPMKTFLLGPGDEEARRELTDRLRDELGEMESMVEALVFMPGPPAPPKAPGPPAPPGEEVEKDDRGMPKDPMVIELGDSVDGLSVSELPPGALDGATARQLLEGFQRAFVETLEAAGQTDGPQATPTPAEEAILAWAETHASAMAALAADAAARHAEQAHLEGLAALVEGLDMEIRDGDRIMGQILPKVDPETLLRQVFAGARRELGEIPFAVDGEGNIYPEDGPQRGILESLAPNDQSEDRWVSGGWAVATTLDAESGVRLGIARPYADSLRQLQATSARNFRYGLALVALALLGILPLSQRISRQLRDLTEGVQRIARGDLGTRVEPRGRGEIGQLASAVNTMAGDLADHQRRLVEEERRGRDREIEQRLIRAEYERKSCELEEARQFQLSLLPKRLPTSDAYELAVHVATAAEVGGDYYDFHPEDGGALTLAVGDATGHGARAGTMVTVVKSLLATYSPAAVPPERFLTDANAAVRSMDLGRMAMALVLLRLEGRELTIANAGMPPVWIHRAAGGEVEEIALPGMPLGGLPFDYRARRLTVAPGDTVLAMSDGLPEHPADDGAPVGYDAVRRWFADAADSDSAGPADITTALTCHLERLTDGGPPADDVSLLVLRIRG
ncbi:MAG: SpoIIE family protein phosphatase [Acidobacteriota bacterium]